MGGVLIKGERGTGKSTGNFQASGLTEFTDDALAAVAWLAAPRLRSRLGAFLVAFGTWDLAYYLGLYALLRWPPSLANGFSIWDAAPASSLRPSPLPAHP